MTSRRAWWLTYALGSIVVVAALGWVTLVLLRLEQTMHRETRHQESVRLALWRMDSWLGPQLASESARPYFEYLPFYPQERAYTRLLNPINPAEVLTSSPLLDYDNPLFPIHFQIDPEGVVTSPQVPAGNQRELAAAVCTTGVEIDKNAALLAMVMNLPDLSSLRARLNESQKDAASSTTIAAVPDEATFSAGAQGQDAAPRQQQQEQQWLTQKEYSARAGNYNQQTAAQQAPQKGSGMSLEPSGGNAVATLSDAAAEQIVVGPLAALWISPDGAAAADGPRLIFARQVRVGGRDYVQGFLADWPRMREALLGQIHDLFPAATLLPAIGRPNESTLGVTLAAMPATLQANQEAVAPLPILTPARTALALAWLAVAGAILATGLTLRASIAYGDKRSRFASAVTHELRTPLTTFRMYTEMLADGMVTDEPRRREYLGTLQRESARLAALVENVLTYARLEDRRPGTRHPAITLADLLDRLRPLLGERATGAGMTLLITDAPRETVVLAVDADAVGQILFNLVDNACKYAGAATDRRIHLEAKADPRRATISVRDHGPGVPSNCVRAIFDAFERGAHRAGDTTPGVGLGLALARRLARELNGDVTLDHAATGGATFHLTLPRHHD